MAEKETKFCSDCIHYNICYKIEHYGRDLEDTSACKQFIGKDVAPVKHGHWYNSSYLGDEITCSKCSVTYNIFETDGAEDFDYCPNCGAKMDGDKI